MQERGNKKLKWIDQNIGPLLLQLIAWSRKIYRFISQKKKPNIQTSTHIAFLKLAAIGDTVLLSALIADLHEQFPKIKITLFVGASNQAYAKMLPFVDQVVVLPIKNPFKALKLIRQDSPDYLINADSWPRLSALLGVLSKAKWVVGFKTSGQYRHVADDELVSHDPNLHEIENYRNLLRAIDIEPRLAPLQPVGQSVDFVKNPAIVFHLWPGGTKSFLREWKFESWKVLLAKLASESDASFYLTGAPDQFAANKQFIEQLEPEHKVRVTNCAGISLAETVGLLKKSDLLISVDTGIMHVGAALGIATISLHGPSNPRRWGPIGKQVYPIQSPAAGSGKLILGFEYTSDINFLDAINPDSVFLIAQKALANSIEQKESRLLT